MTVLPDSSPTVQKIKSAVELSIVNEIIDLYFIAQNYAYHSGLVDEVEPAYLAITSNQGGYARKGFHLTTDKGLINKKSTPYIDIREDAAIGPTDRLMSFTQLYPHELGHVLYHLLSMEDTVSQNHRSVDMHYFSLITDYPTAFNEGFAEHMENISRMNESNLEITAGIQEDMEDIQILVDFSRPRFRRDIKHPFRLGYYKTSMINWFQKYEDYKRYAHAISCEVRYGNTTPSYRRVEDRLTYRNTGLDRDTTIIRNAVQLHSTEGVISSFFTRLSTSKAQSYYQDRSFYIPFTNLASEASASLEEIISPTQNLFIKYFYVFRNYLVENNSTRSQWIDFMEGYCQSFPDEDTLIKKIYQEVTATMYSIHLPPPLWILVNDYNHRMPTLDPFGGIEVPIYTFDLNAAEEEDLLTLEGISSTDAKSILDYRKTHGLYQSLAELHNVTGLSAEKAELITSSAFDSSTFEETLGNFDSTLTLQTLVVKPLISILLKVFVYFAITYFFLYIFSQKVRTHTFTSRIMHILRYFIAWVITSFFGLFLVVLISNPIPVFLVFGAVLLILIFLIYRKRKISLIYTSSMFLMMLLVPFLSMI
jgi:hypothetical protein